MLFKRKADHKDPAPNMFFLVVYSNFVFQIYLPLCSQYRKLIGGKMDLTFIPTFLDLEGVKLTRKKLDMNSKEKIKEDKDVVLQFDKIVDMQIEPTNHKASE